MKTSKVIFISLGLVFSISLIMNAYLYFQLKDYSSSLNENFVESAQNQLKEDKVKLKTSAIASQPTSKKTVKRKITRSPEPEPENVPHYTEERESMDEIISDMELEEEAFYEKLQTGWQSNVKELFIEKLGLEERDIENYLELKDQYHQEVSNIYNEAEPEIGNNDKVYIPSFEESKKVLQIQEKYLNRLKNYLGDYNYEKLQTTKKRYNQKMAKISKNPGGVIYFIDF